MLSTNSVVIENELKSHGGLYELEQQIGQGNFACVWKAHHKLAPVQVAIKVIDKRSRNEADLIKIHREISILKKLRHPNIIKLYQYIETEDYIFLVTELCPKGELFDLIDRNGRLREDDARRIFSEILSAVEHAHRNGIVHRDLKTENVLLDKNLSIKLADFGFGQYFEQGRFLNTWCGSPPYAAPEVFEGREYEGPELDVWSLGCILYVLVCGKLPFDAPDMAQLKERITNGWYQVHWSVTNECFDLIRKCLTTNPQRRIKTSVIRSHAWMMNLPSVIQTDEESISEEILTHMLSAGIDRQQIITAVEMNSFNGFYSLYHLLLDERRRALRHSTYLRPRPAPIPYPQIAGQQIDAQQPQLQQSQPAGRGRRHTFDNALSGISPQQQEMLYQAAQQSQNHTPAPHIPVMAPVYCNPSSMNLPKVISPRVPVYPPHSMSMTSDFLPAHSSVTDSQRRAEQLPASATSFKRTCLPPPPVSQNRSRSKTQGRRASDGLIDPSQLPTGPLFEQVDPTHLIHEAETDSLHMWSSIRHPSGAHNNKAQVMRTQTRRHPTRPYYQPPLSSVPEDQSDLSHLTLGGAIESLSLNNQSISGNQMVIPNRMEQLLRNHRMQENCKTQAEY